MNILNALITNESKIDLKLVRKIGKELSQHENPAPMPGYGQIFMRGSVLYYVGGDGDEKGWVKLVMDVAFDVAGVFRAQGARTMSTISVTGCEISEAMFKMAQNDKKMQVDLPGLAMAIAVV